MNKVSKANHDAVDGATTLHQLVQLLKLSSLINRPMADGVADVQGISLNELKIMMCLGGEGALAGHDITEIMAISPMNVSRALACLQQRAWIEPAQDGTNRRRKPFQLSQKGWQAHHAMAPSVGSVANYLLSDLTDAERKTMMRVSGKIINRMADWFEEYHQGTSLKHP